jgi:hypothetical protein
VGKDRVRRIRQGVDDRRRLAELLFRLLAVVERDVDVAQVDIKLGDLGTLAAGMPDLMGQRAGDQLEPFKLALLDETDGRPPAELGELPGRSGRRPAPFGTLRRWTIRGPSPYSSATNRPAIPCVVADSGAF